VRGMNACRGTSPRSGRKASPGSIYDIISPEAPWAHACWSKDSCARRLKASAATVLSSRGAMKPHVQCEQHQPVKSSSSAQIIRLVISKILMWNREGRTPVWARKAADRRSTRSNQTQTAACRRRNSPTERPGCKVTSVCRPYCRLPKVQSGLLRKHLAPPFR
jgi:hypothetical protein